MTFHIGLKQEIQKILHYMLLSNMKGRLVASYRLNFPCSHQVNVYWRSGRCLYSNKGIKFRYDIFKVLHHHNNKI